MILKGNFDRSSFLENLGNGKFKVHELPLLAQIAPVNGMLVDDVNNDGKLDLLMVGNDYGNEVFSGRYDAFNGLILLGDGNGGFDPLRSNDSGFLVPGDAKSMAMLHDGRGQPIYLSTQNRGKLKVHQNSKIEGNYLKIPQTVHSVVIEFVDGRTRKVEVKNRSGFLSNSSNNLLLSKDIKSVIGIDYNGNRVDL